MGGYNGLFRIKDVNNDLASEHTCGVLVSYDYFKDEQILVLAFCHACAVHCWKLAEAGRTGKVAVVWAEERFDTSS